MSIIRGGIVVDIDGCVDAHVGLSLLDSLQDDLRDVAVSTVETETGGKLGEDLNVFDNGIERDSAFRNLGSWGKERRQFI